jgi:polyhydroxyalkanoate synthesis regulator phasin
MSVIRNIMYLGVGMATVTREKIEQAVDDLVKRGEVASADRAKAIDELQQRAQAAAAEVRKVVDDRIESLGKRFRWAEEIDKLRSEVEHLKAKVDELDKAEKPSGAARKKTGSNAKSQSTAEPKQGDYLCPAWVYSVG